MAAIVYSRATLLMPLTVPIQGTVTTRHYCQCRQSRQYSSRRHLKVWAESGAGPSVFSCGTRREKDKERQPQPPSASTRQGNLTVQPFPVLPSPPQWMAIADLGHSPPPKKKKTTRAPRHRLPRPVRAWENETAHLWHVDAQTGDSTFLPPFFFQPPRDHLSPECWQGAFMERYCPHEN